MTLTRLSISERHREVAADFAALTRGVSDWESPTPVAEWRTRDIVDHLIAWLPGLLAMGSDVRLSIDTTVADDPVEAWREFSAAVQGLLDDTRIAGAPFRSSMLGELTVEGLIDRFYTADVFMHSWDLARASGQDHVLDPALARAMLEGMRSMEDTIRASGQFGTEQPVADDAPMGEKLMAFAGRDTHWRR